MKKLSTVLTGILLSSALFTACSKNDNNMAVSPNGSPSASAKEASSVINFRSGGISASGVTIMTGQKTLYQTDKFTTVDLGSYAVNLNIKPVSYPNLTVKINTRTADGRMNLWLSDKVAMEDGQAVQVMFVIEEPISLSTSHRALAVTDATTMMELLNIKGDGLATEITMDMLVNAEKDGDVLKISRSMNPDMYQVILERLKTMLDISYINTDPGPTTSLLTAPTPTIAQTPDPKNVNGAGIAPTAMAPQRPGKHTQHTEGPGTTPTPKTE